MEPFDSPSTAPSRDPSNGLKVVVLGGGLGAVFAGVTVFFVSFLQWYTESMLPMAYFAASPVIGLAVLRGGRRRGLLAGTLGAALSVLCFPAGYALYGLIVMVEAGTELPLALWVSMYAFLFYVPELVNVEDWLGLGMLGASAGVAFMAAFKGTR